MVQKCSTVCHHAVVRLLYQSQEGPTHCALVPPSALSLRPEARHGMPFMLAQACLRTGHVYNTMVRPADPQNRFAVEQEHERAEVCALRDQTDGSKGTDFRIMVIINYADCRRS
mmetsp:Transcript_63772/g.106406  ORF Transcript_63772/g.106406 Transcript_63772/m.106406 type:complete len:114 (+) Transcript_63772:1188-1529(+)